MPTAPLPENPSLEQLTGHAKFVRDLIRAQDPGGLALVDELHPNLQVADLDDAQMAKFTTTDAQLVVARMYRFPSWNRLRAHITVINAHSFTPVGERAGNADRSASFVEDACLDYAQDGPSPADRIENAHRMLEADPALATDSIAALATVGNHRVLTSILDNDPDAVNEPVGPNGWPPLLYAVYSRISTDNPAWSTLDTVALLLDRGADPNVGFLWRGLVPPFTALTGAFGGGESHQAWHAQRLAVARLLLNAGADPNDGQLLYNNGLGGQNHDDPAYLQLLGEYRLGTQQNGPWYQLLGDQLRNPAELLYDELEVAATRNRPTILGYLAGLGLDLDRPVGRSQLTPARIAAAEGHYDILAILADAGVHTDLTPVERAIQHTRSNQTTELLQLLDDHPALLTQLQHAYPGLCSNISANDTAMLELLIDLGFDINDRTNTKTALHHAAEANDLERARLLITHGADPNLLDAHIGASPWGWANHFGNTETANYLHPHTHHGDPLPEVTIRYANTSRTLSTPELIEQLLDHLHRQATEPEFVRLEAAQASLTIGLGRSNLSIALYLETDNTPWHAAGDVDLAMREQISFFSDGKQRDFYPTTAITLDAARTLAREFYLQPSIRPPSATWVPEGNSEQSET